MSTAGGVAAGHGHPARARAGRVAAAVWPPLLFGAVFVTVWEAAVRVFDLQPYFLPSPGRIWSEATGNLSPIASAAWVTGSNAFVGLAAGTVLGVTVSFALMRFRVLNDMLTPLAIALNAVPIIVLVAVFNNMFSGMSEIPRRLMVALIVYFVVLVNVARGLRQVSPIHLELLRSYAATPVQVIGKARIPNAVPYLFTALKIAAPLAVITAVVSEYFGGPQSGLGNRITGAIAASRNATAWGYVLGACLLGLAFYLVSIVMESITTPRSRGDDSRGSGPRGGTT